MIPDEVRYEYLERYGSFLPEEQLEGFAGGRTSPEITISRIAGERPRNRSEDPRTRERGFSCPVSQGAKNSCRMAVGLDLDQVATRIQDPQRALLDWLSLKRDRRRLDNQRAVCKAGYKQRPFVSADGGAEVTRPGHRERHTRRVVLQRHLCTGHQGICDIRCRTADLDLMWSVLSQRSGAQS